MADTEKLEAEIAALKHDIERYIDINAELHAENATLRAANKALVDETLERVEDAIKPFAAFAEKARRFVQGRADFGGSPIMPTKQFSLADFERAEALLTAIRAMKGE